MRSLLLKRHRSEKETGSVVTECVIVIPLLLIIFSGLTELGRTFSQINWVANTSYEVALAGGGTPELAGGNIVMEDRYSQLKDIPYYKVNFPSTANSNYNPTTRTVSVSIHATLPTLLSYVSPAFDVHATAPILVLGNGVPGRLSVFENPADLYDCCGNVLPGGALSPASCIPMPAC